jgi:transposase
MTRVRRAERQHCQRSVAIRTLMTRLGGPDVQLGVAYEAGPTGCALHRATQQQWVLSASFVAPSLIPKRPGDKVKTGRRDALKLARLLRSGDLTAVWVPDEAHAALRNLVRARADAKVDQLRAKHRLSKFLLRQGCHPPVGMKNWSQRHFQWLPQLHFEHAADPIVFTDYLAVESRRALSSDDPGRRCSSSSRRSRCLQSIGGGIMRQTLRNHTARGALP